MIYHTKDAIAVKTGEGHTPYLIIWRIIGPEWISFPGSLYYFCCHRIENFIRKNSSQKVQII